MKLLGLGLLFLSGVAFGSSVPVVRPDPVGDYVHVEQWESKDAMIEYSKKGRRQFMDVIYSIRNNSVPFVSKERVYQNIMMLDTLRQIEIDIQFPVFQDSPVQSLGAFLVNSIIKQMDFTTDDQAFILKSFFWAKFEARYDIIQNQGVLVRNRGASLEQLTKFYNVLSNIIDYFKSIDEVLFLIDAAAQLQNLIFQDMLEFKVTQEPKNLYTMLQRLNNSEGIMVVLRRAARTAPLLQTDEEILAYLTFLEQLQDRVRQLPSRNDDDINATFSDLFAQVAGKALDKPLTIPTDRYKNLVKSLMAKEILLINNQLVALDLQMMTESQIKTGAFLAYFILDFLKSKGYTELVPKIQRTLGQMQMLNFLKSEVLEGIYELKNNENSQKKPWLLIVARSGAAEIIASIVDSNGKHKGSVSYSKYNVENETVEIVSHLDLESTANPEQPKFYQQIILKKMADEKLTVTFYDGLNNYNFVAKKTIKTPELLGDNTLQNSLKLLNGVFVGPYSKNTALRLRMIFDSTGGIKNVLDLISCQTYAETVFYMVLPYYYNLTEQSAVQFTDRALSTSTPFRQIRLAYESVDVLKGFYISGSMSNYKSIAFERMNSNLSNKEICKAVGL